MHVFVCRTLHDPMRSKTQNEHSKLLYSQFTLSQLDSFCLAKEESEAAKKEPKTATHTPSRHDYIEFKAHM